MKTRGLAADRIKQLTQAQPVMESLNLNQQQDSILQKNVFENV
jgi:hypothetical protein